MRVDCEPLLAFMAPVYDAAARGDANKVAELLASGMDPNARGERGQYGWTPLLVAIKKHGANVELITTLLGTGERLKPGCATADVNLPESDGHTPLMAAACRGLLPVIDMLVERGADLNVASFHGMTALHVAVHYNWGPHPDAVRRLLERGADASVTGRCKKTPLQYACEHKHAACIEILEHPEQYRQPAAAAAVPNVAAPVPVVTGVVVAPALGAAVSCGDKAGSSSGADPADPPPLIEMVAVFKRELAVEGNVKEVVHAAAEQLGVEAGTRPLQDVALACMEAIHGPVA